jgi:2-polyprenyl-3-methyl-5-hydroxy-6-metoxy-1,4-benzoquinol methylase
MEEFEKRQLEPELMNGAAQVDAYAAANFSGSDNELIEFISAQFPNGLGEHIIDLGCGPGNITELAAKRWSHAHVLGIDGAPRMLEVAEYRRDLINNKELSLRIKYECLNLSSINGLSLPKGLVSRRQISIISNSLLHHLHEPSVLWNAVKKLAFNGACVVVNDLRRPKNKNEFDLLMGTEALNLAAVLKADYAASLRAAFTVAEVKKQLRAASLTQLNVLERGNRYLTVWGWLDPVGEFGEPKANYVPVTLPKSSGCSGAGGRS